MIAWLADQPWCDGNVGMCGTSYSGFNSLQIACERPPALKAICAIYASDDRWTDDVHWRGGALRLVDLVDYCHYMTPMYVLPPVPAVWRRRDWREEWQRRLETNEPWVLTWLRENRDGPYWRHGSVRVDGDGHGYDRIECPTMIVAGWADGYRNNSFRTVEALRRGRRAAPAARRPVGARRPGHRVSPGRGSTSTARWSRGGTAGCAAAPATEHDATASTCSCATSTPPEPDLELHEGYWVTRRLAVAVGRRWHAATARRARASLVVEPDVGTAAWIDCAGHLPWGLSVDQREDDARSLTWEWPTPTAQVLVGQPRGRGCGSAPTRRPPRCR